MGLSRLQLAAALLEYDNDDLSADGDPSSPTARPRVSHRDSALFQPFQPRPLDHLPSPSSTYRLSHPTYFPNDPPTDSHQQSYALSPRSAASRGPGSIPPPENEEPDMSRWDLPAHLLPSSASPAPTAQPSPPLMRQNSRLPPVRSVQTGRHQPVVSSPMTERARSVHLDVALSLGAGGRSGSTDADWEVRETLERAERVRRLAEDSRGEGLEEIKQEEEEDYFGLGGLAHAGRLGRGREQDPQSIALPISPASSTFTTAPHRPLSSVSGLYDSAPPQHTRRTSQPTMIPLPVSPRSTARPISSLSRRLSMDPREELRKPEQEFGHSDPNPFALPAPPPELGSRFDPKILQVQRQSLDVGGRPPSRVMPDLESDDDVTPRARTISQFSDLSLQQPKPTATEDDGRPVSRVWDDIPPPEVFGRPLMPNRYSTSALHFAKLDRQNLLRPKTLVMPAPLYGMPEPVRRGKERVPEGFEMGEKPLPEGARSSILVPGREGQELDGDEGEGEEEGAFGREGERRGPGRLYGTSLIDQLERRKAAMKGKQRVFTGDSRPAMMSRQSLPAADIPLSPPKETSPAHSASLVRRQSTRQPLLQFDSNGDLHEANMAAQARLSKSKSVFGVDELWEKEMRKLGQMQAREEAAREARQEAEEKLSGTGGKKGKKDRKGKGKAIDQGEEAGTRMSWADGAEEDTKAPEISPVETRLANVPPVLHYEPERAVPPSLPGLTDGMERRAAAGSRLGMGDWFESSDEEGGGGQPSSKRKVTRRRQSRDVQRKKREDTSDEEDEVPLSRIAKPRNSSVSSRLLPTSISTTNARAASTDSDEDLPLSRLKSPVASRDGGGPQIEDDDVPLALRIGVGSPAKSSAQLRDDAEDDLPLGYKHAGTVMPRPLMGFGGYSGPPTTMSGYGMGGWGSPMMPMPVLSPYGGGVGPMPFPAYPGMSPGMGMLMPNVGGMGMSMGMGQGQGPGPGPELRIDNWRREVPAGRAGSAASASVSVASGIAGG